MPRPRTTSDEAILAATARAIGRHGVGGLTLALAAREAGLSPATLVQRFGSKRGLLLALARQAGDSVHGFFAKAREKHGAGSPLEALHAALAGLASDVQTPEEMASSLGFLQLDLTDPQFREHATEHARRMREEIAALLAEAAAAGELTPGTDPRRLARAVQITYNGALLVWGMSGDGRLADALRADIDHLLGPYRA